MCQSFIVYESYVITRIVEMKPSDSAVNKYGQLWATIWLRVLHTSSVTTGCITE
jgi:hypothetical protein